jgi:hypothetical protein
MPERAGRKAAGVILDFRFAILDLETGRRQSYGLIKLAALGFWFWFARCVHSVLLHRNERSISCSRRQGFLPFPHALRQETTMTLK